MISADPSEVTTCVTCSNLGFYDKRSTSPLRCDRDVDTKNRARTHPSRRKQPGTYELHREPRP